MASEVRQLDLVLKLQDQASKELAGIGGKLESLQPAFQKMAIAGTAAFIAIGAGIGKTVKDAVNLGESVNAVNVVFGDGAKDILKFGENSAKAVGMASSEFNQMATITGALLKDTGKPMSEVANMTVELTKRAADMASVFNTDVNDAMSAINQAIRGETEAIRRYAGDVTDATLETFALSKGIKTSVTDMTQQEKRLLRVQLIMEQTKVTANDFQNTSESLANQQRILSAEFTNISATIGNSFIPVITDVLNTVKPIIQNISEWVKQNPELTKNIIIASAALAGLVAVIGTLGLILPPLIAGFTILLGPVGLVILAITALVAAGVLLYKNWDVVKEKAILVWTSIKDFFSETLNFIVGLFALYLDLILPNWQSKFKAMYNFAVNIFTSLKTFFSEIWSSISSIFRSSIDKISNFLDPIIEKITGLVDMISNIGGDFFKGVGNGIEAVKERGRSITGVNDAIISPNGNIITTDPKDYLIATKKPGELAGAGGGVNVVINYPMVLDRNAGDMLADVISESLRRKLRI